MDRLTRVGGADSYLRFASSVATLTVEAVAEDLFHIQLRRRGEVSSLSLPANAVVPRVGARVESRGRQVRMITSMAEFRFQTESGAWKIIDSHGLEVFHAPARATGFAGSEFRLRMALRERESIFGLGAGIGALDQRGCVREFGQEVRSDTATTPQGADPGSIPSVPFALSLRDGRVAGLFVHTSSRQVWDLGHSDPGAWTISALGGAVDLYLFTGPRLAPILTRFTERTGRPPLPPRWSFGYHQTCGGSPGARSDAEGTANEFRKRHLPCDGLIVHRSFHPATHRESPDANPVSVRGIERLERRGFKVMEFAGWGYDPSSETALALNHGKAERPPARSFRIARTENGKTRHPGAVWVATSGSGWDRLGNLLPAVLNLGLSGVPMAGFGPDAPPGTLTAELSVRWLQMAVFMPFLMNLTEDSPPRAPWSFGPEVEAVARDHLRLRYQLLPFLYNLAEDSSRTGAPIVRPLVWHHANDPVAARCSDQFLVGESLLVAPVLRPGVAARSVYLPRGEWFDFWTGELFHGGVHIVRQAPLERIPVLVRSGTILPMTRARPFIGRREPKAVILHVWPRDSGTLDWYDDDGRSAGENTGFCQRRRIETRIGRRSGRLVIGAREGPYPGTTETWRIVLRGVSRKASVRVLGKETRSDHVPEIGVLAFDMPALSGPCEACWR
ncbi:MAG: TIM-barrel domain-containing protein [Limisphaerales bacterium]